MSDQGMMRERWRGIGKLTEECGEVLQLLGKAIAFPTGDHPDGKGAIRDRLPLELADLKAAIAYFEEANGLNRREDRVKEKLDKFRTWGLTGVHDLRGADESAAPLRWPLPLQSSVLLPIGALLPPGAL